MAEASGGSWGATHATHDTGAPIKNAEFKLVGRTFYIGLLLHLWHLLQAHRIPRAFAGRPRVDA